MKKIHLQHLEESHYQLVNVVGLLIDSISKGKKLTKHTLKNIDTVLHYAEKSNNERMGIVKK